MLLIVNNLNFY